MIRHLCLHDVSVASTASTLHAVEPTRVDGVKRGRTLIDTPMFFRTASSTPSAKVEPSFIMPWAPPAMFRFMAMVARLLAFG